MAGRALSFERAPWTIPTPVRTGRFVVSERDLAHLNVEVDQGAMPPFGARRTMTPDDELLHVDLQTNHDIHARHRLGAGRAGYYRGRYLKGVGRTPLAANWNDAGDEQVATGHFATSAAIREFVVTRYVRARGHPELVNGCEGVLLAPLARELQDFASYGYPAGVPRAPCDAVMQAVSVKGGAFARFSNIAWFASHLHLYRSSMDLRDLFLWFVAALNPAADVVPADVTPERIATAFSDAIHRAVENFRSFWRLGVHWATVPNNVTMDGRYQDLSPVTFVGGPFLGVMATAPTASFSVGAWNPTKIIGFDVLAFLLCARSFVRFFVARLASLPEAEAPMSANERDFVRQTVAELRAGVGAEHLLFSLEAVDHMLSTWLEEDAHLSGSALLQARAVVHSAARRIRPPAPWQEVEVAVRPLPLGASWAVPHIATFCPLSEQRLAEAQFMNDLVLELEAITDPERLLARLRDVEPLIEREYSEVSRVGREG